MLITEIPKALDTQKNCVFFVYAIKKIQNEWLAQVQGGVGAKNALEIKTSKRSDVKLFASSIFSSFELQD